MSNYAKKTWTNGVDPANQTNLQRIEDGIAAVPGVYFLATPYRFASAATLTSGSTTAYQITGNGTPTIPSGATGALVSFYGIAASASGAVSMGPNGYSYTDPSQYPLLGQSPGGNGDMAGSAIVPLNTSNGKLDVKALNAQINTFNASVYGYIY